MTLIAHHAARAATLAIVVHAVPTSKAAEAPDFKPVAHDVSDFGYLLAASRWTWTPLEPKTIFVCWENPAKIYSDQMMLVKNAVTSSWQAHSAIVFQGWEQTCQSNSVGVRIRISDEGPHTKGLGKFLDGVGDGMVLNFDFNHWSPTCKNASMYNKCVASIAVHEFGHALGLAHEQNRPDTPGECGERPQGTNGDTLLTPWDPQSVMNYCNPVYNNDGVLSPGDESSVQKAYGRPQ